MKVVVMVAAAVTSAALFSPTASHARELGDFEQVRTKVSTKGLDLGTPAGRAAFEKRLTSRIQRMCTDTGRRGLEALAATKECVASARQG